MNELQHLLTSSVSKLLLDGFNEEEIEQALIQLAQKRYKDSLYLTAKELLGYKEMTEHTHKKMCDALQSQSKRKLIVMPRGTFKSSIGCVAYPIWLLMNNPNQRICIDSEVYANSKNFIRGIKGRISTEDFTRLFGRWDTDKWTESEFITPLRTIPHKEPSVCAMSPSTSRVGQHYSTIICDDLNSNNNSGTPEACEKIIEHYRYLTSILEPDGTMIIIGTRYSEADLIGHILENEVNRKGLL